MGFFSQALGYRTAVELASSPGRGVPQSPNLGSKSSGRVKREDLEWDYRNDPTIFNIINKQTQLIMHAGFVIEANKKQDQTKYDEFFEDIGIVGEQTTKEELLEYIAQDSLMYGNAYVELIYDAGDVNKKIVDLKMIAEKKMDYIKDGNRHILLDKVGRPVGYTMTFPSGVDVSKFGDDIPKKYKHVAIKEANQIYFLPQRIAHFKLHTYGDRFYGIGLIEPAHKSTERKLKIEEARTNEIYTRGANTIVASVGDTDHEPGPQQIQDVLDQIVNFKHNRYFSFPHWVKLDTLNSSTNDVVEEVLDYLRVNQAASAGMPRAFATGAGEATNRATLNNQQQILELSLEQIVNKLSSAFNKYILKPIKEANGYSDYAKIEFGDVRAEEKNDKSKRLSSYIQSGVIAPEEVRKYAISSEDLVEDKKAFDKMKKVKEEPKEDPSQKPVESKKPKDKEELSKSVELGGGFYMPDMTKFKSIKELDGSHLLKRHENLHVLWGKLEEGYNVGWTFEELYSEHSKVLERMKELNIVHLNPINELDRISM